MVSYLYGLVSQELSAHKTLPVTVFSDYQLKFNDACEAKDYKTVKQLMAELEKNHAVHWNGAINEFISGSESIIQNVRSFSEESKITNDFFESIYQQLAPGGQIITLSRPFPLIDVERLTSRCVQRKFQDLAGSSLDEVMRKMSLPFFVSENFDEPASVIMKMGENKKSIILGGYTIDEGNLFYRRFGNANIRRSSETFSVFFHQYRIRTDSGKTIIVMAENELDVGSHYRIKGMLVEVRDESKIGETTKIPTDLPVLFLISAASDIIEIDLIEFHQRVHGWDHEVLVKKTFGSLRHPIWFEKFIISWLFSGEVNGYPLHIMWVGPTGSGKTTGMLDPLSHLFRDQVYDGTKGTFKGLVPHYGGVLAEVGYLAMARRLALVDEFFQSFARNTKAKGDIESEAGLMTSLLEHKEHAGGSGKHETIQARMRARALFASNPLYALKNMQQICERFPQQMMSRFIWYFQTDQHYQFVQERKLDFMDQPPAMLFPERDDRYIEIIDFLQSFIVKLPKQRISEIYDKYEQLMPLGAEMVYKGRSYHHIACILDGIVKYNTIVEQRLSFDVTEKDIKEADEIFGLLMSTWNENLKLQDLPVQVRINFIPLRNRVIYDIIVKEPGITAYEIGQLTGRDVRQMLRNLEELQLIKTDGDKQYPYWYDASLQHLTEA